jgi:mercuric ion transport protein
VLCCFTPVLVVLLSGLGLAAFAAKLDYLLVPTFVVSIALVTFALVRRRRTCAEKTPQPN